MTKPLVELSKFLSFVLRHQPGAIDLALDAQGWVSIDTLIAKADAHGTRLTRDDVMVVVQTSDKKRFSVSEDGQRIRAAQGHSIAVELGLAPQRPPPVLYHGTATRFVASILAQGLTPGQRQQVHLSADAAVAHQVGQRHGKPAIFMVDALGMQKAGLQFFVADNGVWLTDRVPSEFLALVDSSSPQAPQQPG